MAEEKNTTPLPALAPDDVDALRLILHRVRGISPVSVAPQYIPISSEEDSGE